LIKLRRIGKRLTKLLECDGETFVEEKCLYVDGDGMMSVLEKMGERLGIRTLIICLDEEV